MKRIFNCAPLLVTLAMLVFAISCNRYRQNEPENGTEVTPQPEPELANDWYAAGMSIDLEQFAVGATIWKNGKVLYSNMEPETISTVLGICVDGDDVYCSGYLENRDGFFNVVWKNDQRILTIDAEDDVLSGFIENGFIDVAVVRGDVYALTTYCIDEVFGQFLYQPMLFKNGVPELFDLVSEDPEVVSIEASGDDLYAVGSVTVDSATVPALWKNKIATTLTLPQGTVGGSGYSLSIIGSDVYVVGEVYASNSKIALPCVWKNGVPQLLETFDKKDVLATGVAVKDGKLYVSGAIDDDYACVWEDGVMTVLDSGYATDVVSTKDGVVVGGCMETESAELPVAAIWKDGIADYLGYGVIVRMSN